MRVLNIRGERWRTRFGPGEDRAAANVQPGHWAMGWLPDSAQNLGGSVWVVSAISTLGPVASATCVIESRGNRSTCFSTGFSGGEKWSCAAVWNSVF